MNGKIVIVIFRRIKKPSNLSFNKQHYSLNLFKYSNKIYFTSKTWRKNVCCIFKWVHCMFITFINLSIHNKIPRFNSRSSNSLHALHLKRKLKFQSIHVERRPWSWQIYNVVRIRHGHIEYILNFPHRHCQLPQKEGVFFLKQDLHSKQSRPYFIWYVDRISYSSSSIFLYPIFL